MTVAIAQMADQWQKVVNGTVKEQRRSGFDKDTVVNPTDMESSSTSSALS